MYESLFLLTYRIKHKFSIFLVLTFFTQLFHHFLNKKHLYILPSVDVRQNKSDPVFFPPPVAALGNQCISVGNTSSGSLTREVVSLFIRFHFNMRWSSAPENSSSGVVQPTQLTSSVCKKC